MVPGLLNCEANPLRETTEEREGKTLQFHKNQTCGLVPGDRTSPLFFDVTLRVSRLFGKTMRAL